MFSNTVIRRRSKFSSTFFIAFMFAAASLAFGAFGSVGALKAGAPHHEKLVFAAQGFKAIISGAYFSPAATFVVSNAGDTTDAVPGDGICGDASGNCTLRAAIQEANASAGTDSITFAFTSAQTIQLDAALSPAGLNITEAVSISGPGARLLTISGNAATTSGIFNITSAVTTQANISGLTITKSGAHGINNAGRLNLSDVSIKNNGSLSNPGNGINNSGRLTINRATISSNNGSGINLTASSIVNISNTTITLNSSTTSGGGIYSLSADVTLNNVTISHNSASTKGGGIYYSNAAAGFFLRNTIVSNNASPTDKDVFAENGATTGKFVSRGNNLIGKNSLNSGFVNLTNNDKVGTDAFPVDPLLGNLQNNGGATDTRALLTGSPAIDAGNMCVISSSCGTSNPSAALTNDQRGTDFPRIYDGNNDNTAATDIGAFEAFYPVAVISSFAPNNWGTGRGAFELIINGTNFVADSKVKWNGQDRTTTFVSNTQIKAQITASDATAAGQFPVTIVNPAPGGGTSEAANFPIVNCSYSVSPNNQTFTPSGGSSTFSVTAVNGCAWTATTDAPWITITGGTASGTGNGTVSYAVAAWNGPVRTGTILVGGQTFTVTQSSGCTYTISPTGTNAPAAGSTGSLSVMASNSGCTWTATASASWITISPTSGTSNGTINYTIAANAGQARSGSIAVKGPNSATEETFIINQASGCTYALSSPNQNLTAAAGSGTLGVTSGSGCAWTASSNVSWLRINAGAAGSGNGTVSFSFDANTGPSRTATITVNNQTLTFTQANGCTFTITPATANNVAAAGANLSVTVTASSSGCTWTSVVNPANVSWITITSGASGDGSGAVQLTIAANTGSARSGTVTIAGSTYTVNQNDGCTYTLSSSGTTFTSAGGTGTFDVTVNSSGCTWTAVPSVSWITINSSSPGTGNGTVTFTVQPNVTPERTGKITVGNKEFTIVQSNGCTYSLSATNSSVIPASGGTGSFTVNTGAGCVWNAASDAPWTTVGSTASNTGSGTVNFTVAANNGPARNATITAGGKTYTVNQADGCAFTLSASSYNAVAAGGSISVNVTASNTGCAWTTVVAANASWITINGNAGATGNGTVQLTIAANNGPSRTGTVTIGGRTFTITQENGCAYTLSPTGLNINENGGDRSFNVISGAGCPWNVASNASWITILSGASGTGTGIVAFKVAPNTGEERSGTITAGGRTFTVNQVNLIVSNINDDGAGSLRRAVANANASPGDDVITFLPSLSGRTIFLTSGEIKIDGGNGAVEIKGLGADLLKISGSNSSRIFYLSNSNVAISDVTLTGGNGSGTGSTDTTKFGGAIFANGGSLTLNRVSVFFNIISVPQSPLSKSVGGGIYLQDGTRYLIQNSTIFFNSADAGGGLFNQGELKIVNSTIAGNTSTGEGGGGIYTVGLTDLISSTITGNKTTGADKGGGLIIWGGILNIGNSIVAGNIGSEISFVNGSAISTGNNLIGDAVGDSTATINRILYKPSDILDTNPMLAVLEMYGGGTFTAALLPGSPAINAGNAATAPATDQRGAPRVVGEAMDIGAYEQNIVLMPTNSSLPDATVGGSYSQRIEARRIGSVNPNEAFRFAAIDGYLPNGVEIFDGTGIIQGTPTVGGSYAVTVRGMGEDGMAGVQRYTISVGCSYTLSAASMSVETAGGGKSFNLTTSEGCTWTAVSNVPWIMIGSTSGSGTGNGTISFNVAANTGAARTGIITVAGKTFTVSQASGCTYSLSASSANVPHAAGTTSFNLNTGAGCAWTAAANANWLSISGSASGAGAATITVNVAANSGAARAGTVTVGGRTFTVNQAAPPPVIGAVKFDYDGDRKADVSVFRPASGVWHLQRSQAGYGSVTLGNASDKLAPADYDGDGRTDLAVFREDAANPGATAFHIMNSSDGTVRTVNFGSTGDSPAAVGDWDGDGKADVAVYRAGTQANPQGYFYYRPSAQPNSNFVAFPWGSPDDKPAVADFDGDGKVDPAIFRPSNGVWFVQRSRDGFYAIQFGAAEDKPVVGDYDGDGLADQAVFRPSNGVWYLWQSSAGFAAGAFGIATDLPVPADYDGDGKTDFAVYRDGTWYLLNSASGFAVIGFGVATDKPVPNSFVP